MELTDKLRCICDVDQAEAGLYPSEIEAIEEAIALIEKLEADAARWKFVRDNMQSHSLQMGGQHGWRFRSLRGCVGNTPEEAIDRRIETTKP